MTFQSCKFIEHEAVLDQLNKIRHCSNTNREFGGRPIIIDDYYGDTSMLREFFEKKRKLRDMFRNGQCPKTCLDCIHLTEREWDDEDYLNYIVLTPWVACNAKCIYCPIQMGTHVKQNTKDYDYYSTLKYMINNNFFSPDATFDFAGGEPTLYERFEDILKLLDEKGFKNLLINTNSIIYSPSISKLISKGNCKVVTSIDSGNRQLFQRIKQVDAFDKVVDTLGKYAKEQTVKKNAVRSKFIIVPGVNDSKEYILEWLNLSKNLGIISVILNLDFNFLLEHNQMIEQQKKLPRGDNNTTLRVYDLIDFTINEGKKLGITVSLYGEIFTLKTLVEEKKSENIVDD